jgi:SAM-dependent methyltransferase
MPQYGVDAPGVLKAMLGGGIACLSLGALALLFFAPSVLASIASVLLLLAGIVLTFLAGIMAGYARYGKFRQRDFMIGRVDWMGEERTLDIGTGAGLLLIAAAKKLTVGHAYGIDIWRAEDLTDNRPEVARRNAALEGVADRVTVSDGDARRLAFPDQSLDVVLSLYCLHNIEPRAEQAQACKEIARVLRPGGVALLADFVPTHDYARTLEEAGLKIVESRPYFHVAFAPMWMVEARRALGPQVS